MFDFCCIRVFSVFYRELDMLNLFDGFFLEFWDYLNGLNWLIRNRIIFVVRKLIVIYN